MKIEKNIEKKNKELTNLQKAAILANDEEMELLCQGAMMALDWTLGDDEAFPITADMIKEKQSFDF